MIKVGITGGIGSGKSTIAHLFETMGYPVYYADARAKWLMDNDPIIKEQLIAIFGQKVYPGHLEKKILANIVFSNPSALSKLNSITHPAVERDFNNWCLAQDARIVFKEAAILFESGTHKSVDKIICVTAPESLRTKRVLRRDSINEKQVEERIHNQWSDKEKIRLSDFVIKSDDEHLVIPQTLDILNKIINDK